MSKFLALIIDTLNKDGSTEPVMSPTDKIKALVADYYKR